MRLVLLLVVAMRAFSFEPRVRGVNLGGWLVLERWIRPSLMQSCDVNPPDENPDCFWGKVPVDQWTYCEKLLEMGTEKGAAAQGGSKLMDRLHNHWESWVTRENIVSLANVGITHLRLPIGHWILGDIEPPEPYVNGEWPYVLRLVGWAREFGLKVWLDLHTAPGSQNGFDNSGRLGNLTWDKSYHNVWRTVKIIEEIASQVRIDGALDIITGFGVMNEPGPYVPVELLKNFYNDAYIAIRRSMPDAYIYVGDGFNSANFNSFWTGTKQTEHPKKNSIYYVTDGYYANTPNEGWVDDVRDVVLDTHIYQCFTLSMRMMTPREHIEEVCHGDHHWIDHCCSGSNASAPPYPAAGSRGSQLGRMIGEWTVAYDQAPGQALENRGPRPMTPERVKFLRQFATAQMVMYEIEATKSGYNQSYHGWFYWNFKMESKTYEEWDFLSGIEYGWMPILHRGQSAVDQFGTCEFIAENTKNVHGVVDMFPPASWYPDDDTVDDAAGTPAKLGDDDDPDASLWEGEASEATMGAVAGGSSDYSENDHDGGFSFLRFLQVTAAVAMVLGAGRGLLWIANYKSRAASRKTSFLDYDAPGAGGNKRRGYDSVQMVDTSAWPRAGNQVQPARAASAASAASATFAPAVRVSRPQLSGSGEAMSMA